MPSVPAAFKVEKTKYVDNILFSRLESTYLYYSQRVSCAMSTRGLSVLLGGKWQRVLGLEHGGKVAVGLTVSCNLAFKLSLYVFWRLVRVFILT